MLKLRTVFKKFLRFLPILKFLQGMTFKSLAEELKCTKSLTKKLYTHLVHLAEYIPYKTSYAKKNSVSYVFYNYQVF